MNFSEDLSVVEYASLWDLIKCLLTLSHGQAAVERGYSVNKDMLVKKLKERFRMQWLSVE